MAKLTEALVCLLSFDPRPRDSWVWRVWWKIMYLPLIREFTLEVVANHDKYWVKKKRNE